MDVPAAGHELGAGPPDAVHGLAAAGEDPAIEPLVVTAMREGIVVGLQADEVRRLSDGQRRRRAERLCAAGKGRASIHLGA